MIEKIPYNNYSVIEVSLTYLFYDNNVKLNYFSLLVSICCFFSILPIIILIGYTQDVRSMVYNRESNVPAFNNYNRLLSEGYKTLICQLPVIFAVVVSIFAAINISEIFLGFFGLSMYISPIISHKYSKIRDYTEVYPSGISKIMTSDDYVRYFLIYITSLIVLISTVFMLGALTLGIGFILILPILIVYRAVFWGYAFKHIESSLDE